MTTSTADVTEAIRSAMPQMNADERRLAAAVYRALLAGTEPTAAELTEATELDGSLVGDRLSGWPGVFWDGDRVIGFWGLTTQAISPHVVSWNGATSYAWCALDPLFILPTLDETAGVKSTCPTTGREITLSVTPDGVSDVEPASAVMTVLVPDGPFDADVIQSFCHFVHFFADEQAAQDWVAENPGTTSVALADAETMGVTLARRVFGEG